MGWIFRVTKLRTCRVHHQCPLETFLFETCVKKVNFAFISYITNSFRKKFVTTWLDRNRNWTNYCEYVELYLLIAFKKATMVTGEDQSQRVIRMPEGQQAAWDVDLCQSSQHKFQSSWLVVVGFVSIESALVLCIMSLLKRSSENST